MKEKSVNKEKKPAGRRKKESIGYLEELERYGLTAKEKEFCDLYIFSDDPNIRGNATQAALKVYNINGIDRENIASSMGAENLRKPRLKKYINDKMSELANSINEEWIMKEMLKNYIKTQNNDKTNESIKVLEMFARIKAMFTDRNVTEIAGSLADEIDEIIENKEKPAQKEQPEQQKSAKMKDFSDKTLLEPAEKTA